MKTTINAVIAGTKTCPCGHFFPAYIRDNHQIAARWTATVVMRRPGGDLTFISVVAWDTRVSGIASYLAKTAEKGLKIKFDGELISFDKKVFVNGVPVLDKTNRPITTQAHQFLITKLYKETLWERTLKAVKKMFNNDISQVVVHT